MKYIFAIAATIGLMFYSAFTLMCLWNWFVALPFNAPMLNMGMALGINILLGFILTACVSRRDETTFLNLVVEFTISTSLSLGLGFIIHLILG